MMSVALFALTRANYADMRSFYSENEAITNAESAINIASFIIASNPFLFTIDSNNNVNLGNLMDTNTSIINRINSNNYRIAIVNLSTTSNRNVVSNDGAVRASNFAISNNPSQIMAAMIISPRNKSISDSGAILFFGNSTNDTNTYKSDSANAVGISFGNNTINFYFNSGGTTFPSGATYPLYTSVNNVNNNIDITDVNGYRNANKYTLLLMAMGYSRVPNTNRYVVRYVDQKLANGGLLSASLYTGGNASFNTTRTLNIIADQIKNNRLIANNFNVTLVDNNSDLNPKTIFSLTSESTSDVVGKLVATTNDKNTGGYTVGGTTYSLKDLLENKNGILDTVKEKTQGTVENKTISFNFDNTYNNFKNAINSASQNAKELNAGWYIFKDHETIYYYPPDKKINDIIDEKSGQLRNRDATIYKGKLKDSSNNEIATISNYSINFNPNINVKFVNDTGKPAFVFITSFKEQQAKFGAYDVNINLDGNILQAQNMGFVVDGTFKGEGTVAVTGDGSSIGSMRANQFYSFKYFDSSFSNPYDYRDVTRNTNYLTKGTLVTRLDYLKSSYNKVAILVDNDMYINPTFQELNTSFMDYLLMESLKSWAYNYVYSDSRNEDKLDIFQVMTGFAGNKFEINGGDKIKGRDIRLWDVLFYDSSSNDITFNLKDGDFKDYKLKFNTSYKDFVLDSTNRGFKPNLTGSYNNSNGTLTITYTVSDIPGPYSVNINVSVDNISDIYTFRYGGKEVKLPYSRLPQSIKNVIDGVDNRVNFKDFAALWYSILNENPSIAVSTVLKAVSTVLNNPLLLNAIRNNLEGSYNEYKTFLRNNHLTNNPGKDAFRQDGSIDRTQINRNYFAWIDMREGGLTIGSKAAEELGQSGDYSFLNKKASAITDSSNITNAKLEGMVMVKGKLKANTGAGNLTFKGLTLVRSDMNVKSNNTIFQFDLDSIDINLLAGSVINLVPILYRQESVIPKK